jgi:tetratricopeptide (TPR) repeat protein
MQRQPQAPTPPAPSASAAVPGGPTVKTPTLPPVVMTGDILYKVLAADFAAQSGQYDEAARLYGELAQQTNDPRLAELATRNGVFAHDDKLALAAVKHWVKQDPDSLEAHEFAASLYMRSGDEQQALAELHRVLALSPAGSGFNNLASLLSRESDKDLALKIMKKFMVDYAGDADAQYAYSYVAFRKGDMALSEQAIEQALKIRPKWTRAIVFRARLMLVQENTEQAIAYLQAKVKEQPKDKELHYAYAQVLLSAKRVEQAYDQFKEVQKLSPDDGDVLFSLGVLALQLNYVKDAEEYLHKAEDINGRSDELSYLFGQVAEQQKRYDEAIKYYGDVSGGQYFFEAKIRTAALIAKQGDIPGARSALHNLAILMPQRRVDIYLAEGDILRQAEMYDEAMKIYNKALGEFPDNGDILYARAFVAAKLNKLDVAERDLLNILDRDPNNAEALNALGYTLADLTTRYDEALQYIQRALKLRPDDYFVLDSMGWVQYRLGNYDEAVKYLQRAMEKSSDTEVAAHLGEVLWTMGKQDEARDVWQKALKVAPNDKVILEVMKRLEP